MNISFDVIGNGSAHDWSAVWPYFNTGCVEWLSTNHACFQLANLFIFLSYLAPVGFYGLIYLRLMLAIGSAFFAVWAWIFICAFDVFLWNAFFFLINAVHFIALISSLRPVRFDKQVQQVYKNIFQPLKVSKHQFKKVVECISIRKLGRGEHFAVEKQSRVDTLSLLLSGSVLIIENGKTLDLLLPMQFLDSEWFGAASDAFFQVTIQACQESRILIWHREKLKRILSADPFLQAVFDHILGRDVVKKLTQMRKNVRDPARAGHDGNNRSLIVAKSSASVPSNSKSRLGVPPEQLSLLDEMITIKINGRYVTDTLTSNTSSQQYTGSSLSGSLVDADCYYSIVK